MPSQIPSSPRTRLHPNIWFLTIGSFLTDVSSEMLTNLIPLFLYNVLGVRTSIIGLIDGIAETTASLVKIYSGFLSDKLGAAFGLHRAGDTAGAFVGLGLAALIIWLAQSGAAELTRHTFQIVVLVSIITAIAAVLVLALGVKEVQTARQANNALPSFSWQAFDKL